jgi:hypothetical protein
MTTYNLRQRTGKNRSTSADTKAYVCALPLATARKLSGVESTAKKPPAKKVSVTQKKSTLEVEECCPDNIDITKWSKSSGKKYLKEELWDMNSKFHTMNIKEMHQSDNRFKAYPLKNFTTNFKSLKNKVDGLREQVDFDNQAVLQHKELYPRSPNTKRGYPHWDDHPAKQQLEDDVFNGIADTMLPRQLRLTRQSYQEFPESIFCVRLHAEKRKQREQTFWVAKRNKLAMSRHLKEAAEMRKVREW